MLEKLRDRRLIIYTVFLFIFGFLFFNLYELTVKDGEMYQELSVNKRLKMIPIVAKRGEIYDRNGNILAGNIPAYTVQMINNEMNSKTFDEIAVKIIDILDNAKEKHLEFEIKVDEHGFFYSYDANKLKWLNNNGFEPQTTAKEVFDAYRDIEQIAPDLDVFSAQKLMLLKGRTLPISVRTMTYKYDLEKKNLLGVYGLPPETSAGDAFKIIRSKLKIDNRYSDIDAYKIMILKHALKVKGYLKYEPIKIADAIQKSTAVYIDEMSMELPGIKTEIQPVRTYPYNFHASHILGYLGKIATEGEIEKYVVGNNYQKSDLIGKIGIEGEFELDLKGADGYKYVEVDAHGRLIREITDQIPDKVAKPVKAGKNMTLTIDMDLQEAVRDYLTRALTAIKTGGIYESPWGNYVYKKAYEKAETGAVVVLDVNTGEILSMVSYPDYDLNLFATGISEADWQALEPANKNNPLAPKPLYNLATLTAVQPGSTFKMITGFAALTAGMSPSMKVQDGGYIETNDGRTFGCWIWNKSRGSHGMVNLIHALEVSCNYYFFDVSNGYDYARDRALPFDMDFSKVTAAAEVFGLGESTGIEIGETVKGVPNPEQKKRQLISELKKRFKVLAKDYFPPEISGDKEKLEAIANEIVKMADENPTRNAVIRKLIELGANPDFYVTQNLGDIIKYSYFSQMKWFEGDTFNLSIGQGGNAYTPIQMARYIAAIANGGFLNELTLVKSIGSIPYENPAPKFIDPEGFVKYLREGMYLVVNGASGTSRTAFAGFPVTVAAKTGTAQKEGKLPPESEEAYLQEYLHKIAPKITYEALELATVDILRQRNEELSQIERKAKETVDLVEKEKLEKQLKALIYSGYINKGYAMRDALKILTDQKITDETIDAFKDGFDNFTWFVSFAPYDKPEIAVVVFIPQGGSGGYAAPIVKDIYAKYFGLTPPADPAATQTTQEGPPN